MNATVRKRKPVKKHKRDNSTPAHTRNNSQAQLASTAPHTRHSSHANLLTMPMAGADETKLVLPEIDLSVRIDISPPASARHIAQSPSSKSQALGKDVTLNILAFAGPDSIASVA